MSAARRLRPLLVVGTAAALLAGCGSGGSGVSQAKVIAALDMKKVQGRYAIDANPFCSVSKILTDLGAVKDASSSGLVIASRDGTVGVKIVKPFAPKCRNKAERKLDRLAGERKHHRHRKKPAGKKEKGGKEGKAKKGGGNGGKA